MSLPVLYSFRRCPFAMRARLALFSAGISVVLREIVLRDKAPAFVAVSPKATVPVLVTVSGRVIEESLDIMLWALQQNDPEGLLEDLESSLTLIETLDGPYKTNLDRYKYPNRHGSDPVEARSSASAFLSEIDSMLSRNGHILRECPSLADRAAAPFVRQFANTDRAWFDAQPWPDLADWLRRFETSAEFDKIMLKYPKWRAGDPQTLFP